MAGIVRYQNAGVLGRVAGIVRYWNAGVLGIVVAMPLIGPDMWKHVLDIYKVL